MNKQGQIGIGSILLVFIGVIVGVIIFQAIAQQVGTTTNTVTVANDTLGVADNDTAVYLTDYRALSSVVVWNESDVIVPSTNYTVTNNVIDPTTGGLSVKVQPNSGYDHGYTGWTWTISGTAQPPTYIANSGARSMAGLITIFFALLVATIALYPVYQSKVLGN